jgi:hypothetical protein
VCGAHTQQRATLVLMVYPAATARSSDNDGNSIAPRL